MSEINSVKRIHIIGGPGTGKTVLARELSLRTGAPLYELDKVALEGPNFIRRPNAVRLAEVQRIAVEPEWVVEGQWLWWTDELLHSADMIIWLDCLSCSAAMGRIILRFVRGGWGGFREGPARFRPFRFNDYARNLRLLAGALYSAWQYHTGRAIHVSPPDDRAVTKALTAAHLQCYQDKLVHCRSGNDVLAVLLSFDRHAASLEWGKTVNLEHAK